MEIKKELADALNLINIGSSVAANSSNYYTQKNIKSQCFDLKNY